RAAGAVARAEVVGVALVHRGATEHGRGLEGVVRTRRAATRAGLRHVADARGGATGRPAVARRMLAGVTRTVAGVGRAGVAGVVADARRRAARGPRVAGRMLTRVARAVAGIGRADVAVVRARRPARLLRIGRTVRAGARTGLGEVAFARRRATGEGRRLEGVVGTRAAAARAGLGDVAATRR